MRKCIHRLIPYPCYETDSVQSWLECMAANGLILQIYGILANIATFERNTPQTIRYRLIPSQRDLPTVSEQQFYTGFGWKYVTTYGRLGYFHIYACSDPSVPEMETDPQIQVLALRPVICRTMRLFFIALLTFCVPLYWMRHHILQGLVHELWLLQSLFLLWSAMFLIDRTIVMLRIWGLRRRFTHASPLRYRKMEQGFYLGYSALVFSIIPLMLLCICTAPKDTRLRDAAEPIAFASSELYPEAIIRLDENNCHIEEYSTPIAVQIIDYSEIGSITFPETDSVTFEYSIDYYRMVHPQLAQRLAQERAASISANPQSTEMPVEVTGSDLAMAYLDPSWYTPGRYDTVVIIQKDNIVLIASVYTYSRVLPTSLNEFAQALVDTITPGKEAPNG